MPLQNSSQNKAWRDRVGKRKRKRREGLRLSKWVQGKVQRLKDKIIYRFKLVYAYFQHDSSFLSCQVLIFLSEMSQVLSLSKVSCVFSFIRQIWLMIEINMRPAVSVYICTSYWLSLLIACNTHKFGTKHTPFSRMSSSRRCKKHCSSHENAPCKIVVSPCVLVLCVHPGNLKWDKMFWKFQTRL